ncbi:MAG: PP2C family protein-serine/threonine phosphatase [Planctomycetota bacterium]
MKFEQDSVQDMTSLDAVMSAAVRFRTAAVLAILLASAVINVLRILLSPDETFSDVPVAVPITISSIIFYEAATLFWLSKLRDKLAPLPRLWVYTNAAIECAVPTIVAMTIGMTSKFTIEQAALGPASHLYAIFIVLSVLHIRMQVSLVSGAVSAVGLGTLVILAGSEPGLSSEYQSVLPKSLEVFSAALILCTGAAAGLVAMRVRLYLETATQEAKARVRAEQDLRAGALIQQSLMPSEPPVIAGYEVVGWNRPADETGGDYFDWVPLEDGRFAICIADVTGHGLGPAMITCFCRAYARTALRVDNRLTNAVNRLNAELAHDLGPGRFVTFASVLVKPDSDEVISVSAGHGPMLVYRAQDASIESHDADDLPLGIVETLDEIDPVTHSLHNGDLVLLITDGFFEWSNQQGEQFGTRRLKESISRHGGKKAKEVIRGLLADVERFVQGTPQPDDLTAVVIRRRVVSES